MTLRILPRRAALLLALLPIVCACTKQSGTQDALRAARATQHALENLPAACTLDPAGMGARGSWLETTKAAAGPGPGIAHVFSFDREVRTHALRVALNPQGLQDIEKMETRDAQGNWHDAGPVPHGEAPAGCDYVWLVQALPEARQLDALRFSFRRRLGTVTAANPAVLQEADSASAASASGSQ